MRSDASWRARKARWAAVVLACATAIGAAAEAGPLVRRALDAGCEQIIFAVRSTGRDGHWYANFGHHSRGHNNMQYGRPGGWLRRLELRTGKVTDILADRGGSVRDPQVHYDGRKILFSYRKAGTRYFHLYEIGVDGRNLRQITRDASDEIEPIYLPDGDLMFCSSRCNRFVQCWFTQVAILYRCGPDGSDVRPVSCNVEQDNTPWMMPDGRVLYMRWEYVDRSRVRYHHLWTFNPDGTNVMVYFGNMHPGTVLLDAKSIPGTNKAISVFSPGHGRKEHAGRLGVINPDGGPDDRRSVAYIGRGSNYRDPYPLAEDLFLAAENERLLLIDADGRTEVIHRAAEGGMLAHEPRPLRSRPREPVLAGRVNYDEPTGRMILADVTHGRNMRGVEKGDIKKLLVLETLPKPVNFSGTMEPITLGGSFTLPRVLGTVPVEADGSAYMELPALRSLFFVALDERGLSVKRMQSFVTVMPGETISCSGCHERRSDTARFRGGLLATRRRPSRIRPIEGVPDVFDFPRDIQPILDRHCVRCHGYKQRPPRDLPLVGARGPIYSHSYYALMSRGLIAHGRDADGNRPPRSIGTSASRLLALIDPAVRSTRTKAGHEKLKLSKLELLKIRLWIESGSQYPGTYASLGCGMVAARVDARTVGRRCTGCHHARDRRGGARFKYPNDLLHNLTEPDRSPLLLAPLSEAAGGWGLCKGRAALAAKAPAASRKTPMTDPFARRGNPAVEARQLLREDGPAGGKGAPAGTVSVPAVFRSTDDPDYRRLLADIQARKASLDQATRFDMPNFRPNEHYIREMKRYGILPPDADPTRRRIDPYKTDQAYWRSFWFRPSQ